MNQDNKTIQIYFIKADQENHNTTYEVCNEKSSTYTLQEVDELNGNTDTIILHETAELTKCWISFLIECAENYKNIGTVSPLMAVDMNFELTDKNLEELSHAFEVCGEQFYPEVKYNLFDCVYIKKQVFEEIGIPSRADMTDHRRACTWFAHATQMGWKHKVCTQVFMKNGFIFKAGSTIYTERIDFAFRETLNNIYKNLQLFFDMHLNNGRKNVLHYLLADFQEGTQNNVGGTQFHVSDLVLFEKELYNVFVLARDGEFLRLTEYTDDIKKVFCFYVGDYPEYNMFYDQNHEKLYEYILTMLQIDLVHIHHTMWMPLNMYYTSNKLGIPIILSIHDYYYACPVLKMINSEGKNCDKSTCQKDCDACLKNNRGIDYGKEYLEKWYREHNKVILMCKQVVFPSQYAQHVLSSYYPNVKEKSTIIEHGIILPDKKIEEAPEHSRMRIAFIGGISDVKGGPVIYDLITKDKDTFDWYLMGGIAYLDLYHLEQENLIKTGWYKRYEIYDLLVQHEIDLVCILSIIEETFCYTLSETLALGIPVVATDSGALGSRVKKMDCGWLVPRTASSDQIFNLLLRISNNRQDYLEKRNKVYNFNNRDYIQMGKDYQSLYSKYINQNRTKQNNNIFLLKNAQSSIEVEKELINDDKEEYLKLVAAEKELNELKKSFIIRCAIKLRKINFPGKTKLKKLIVRKLKD